MTPHLPADPHSLLAFAQNWTSKLREAILRQQIPTGPHSPAEDRALTVRNIDAWYPSFNIQPTGKLYLSPTTRVRIW